MTLTVLSVAYPFAPVGRDAAGGAEQVLSAIDDALVAAGHRSVVVARSDSAVRGRLVPATAPEAVIDGAVRARGWAAVRSAVAEVGRAERPDVLHLHGIDFMEYLPPPGIPAVVTLHLPPSWYPAEALRPGRPGTWLVPVSRRQHEACPPHPALLAPIENGVPVEELEARHAKRGFALFLGRVCPEKGVHLAIDAAKRAGVPLLVAGELYPYPAHRRYFEEEVRPRLDRSRRFLGPVGFARKRRLLTAARCLLVPSLAEETSSLVAREAAACGTAVVAFPGGALVEAVEEGVTGFLVSDVDGMAAAIRRCATIDPATCRARARLRFPLSRMTDAYLGLYERLAAAPASAAAG